jgi:exosortase family protein XrtM
MPTASPKKSYEWLQFVLFVGTYALLNYGYLKIPDELFIKTLYYHGVVAVCADTINQFAPLEQVVGYQNHLLSTKADLEIVRGCDGVGVLLLLLSAIIAFPANLKRKLFGLALGISLLYAINLLRIGMLYFVVAYYRDWFLLTHTYVAPTLLVLLACLYFAWWAFGSLAGDNHAPA